MEIREIMTPSVDLIGPATTIKDAAVHMRDGDVGALSVGESDQLIGMVTDRDITVRGVASARSPDTCTVREVMSEGIAEDAVEGVSTPTPQERLQGRRHRPERPFPC